MGRLEVRVRGSGLSHHDPRLLTSAHLSGLFPGAKRLVPSLLLTWGPSSEWTHRWERSAQMMIDRRIVFHIPLRETLEAPPATRLVIVCQETQFVNRQQPAPPPAPAGWGFRFFDRRGPSVKRLVCHFPKMDQIVVVAGTISKGQPFEFERLRLKMASQLPRFELPSRQVMSPFCP